MILSKSSKYVWIGEVVYNIKLKDVRNMQQPLLTNSRTISREDRPSYFPQTVVLKNESVPQSPRGLLTYRLLTPIPSMSDPGGLE